MTKLKCGRKRKECELSEYLTNGYDLGMPKKKYVELDKMKAEYKAFMEESKAVTEDLIDEMGIGAHFQDEDGTVYSTDECNGKFVYFDKFEIKRTRREGETKGSLSMKKAEELGYALK